MDEQYTAADLADMGMIEDVDGEWIEDWEEDSEIESTESQV